MKKFNVTGLCIPERHYMVDTRHKLAHIMAMIEQGEYFTINRPRQYGKTTTFFSLRNLLRNKSDYCVISTSFEGIGDDIFLNETNFSGRFLGILANSLRFQDSQFSAYLENLNQGAANLDQLSLKITELVRHIGRRLVLMIDEVDKSSNNQLFVSFLGMLRNKYLSAAAGDDATFHSVILAGVHDVRTLKLKLRPDEERKYNSPWNIASEFTVDLGFDADEIATMLEQYRSETGVEMDISAVAQRLYFFTGGYPYLVSRVCKEIDERLLPDRELRAWTVGDVDEAVSRILYERNTNFDSLLKNLENHRELLEFVTCMILGSREFSFVAQVPWIELGSIYGLFRNENRKLRIHNRIYEELITNYITAKEEYLGERAIAGDAIQALYLKPEGRLDMEKLLLKFQEVIREKYSQTDAMKSDEFLEKELRLLFLVFLKPIINGVGFSFKEVETGAEKRLDIVVVFRDEKFVVELKLWRGESYHREGMERLKGYMQAEGVNKGYMLIVDKRREKTFTSETEDGIFQVWV